MNQEWAGAGELRLTGRVGETWQRNLEEVRDIEHIDGSGGIGQEVAAR
jgi:hypothetical protein